MFVTLTVMQNVGVADAASDNNHNMEGRTMEERKKDMFWNKKRKSRSKMQKPA